ncbi:MAG: hypothetical protein JKY88_02380 [Pseudomonadales bacterium]|nr:hypothetical protein [Pseudomonadales bacterium]
MNADERGNFQAEMRNRTGSMSSEEREALKNYRGEGAGDRKYGSGYESRDGGSSSSDPL